MLERFRSRQNDPYAAAQLSLLFGAGGYVYIGQPEKAIVAATLCILGIWLTCGAASGIVILIAAVDCWSLAKEIQAGRPIGRWSFLRADPPPNG